MATIILMLGDESLLLAWNCLKLKQGGKKIQMFESAYYIYLNIMRTFFPRKWVQKFPTHYNRIWNQNLVRGVGNRLLSASFREGGCEFNLCSTMIYCQSLLEIPSLSQGFMWLSTRCAVLYIRKCFWHYAKLTICAQCQYRCRLHASTSVMQSLVKVILVVSRERDHSRILRLCAWYL